MFLYPVLFLFLLCIEFVLSKDLFQALEIDDTDLNLWYKIGLTGMKLVDLNVAISAFQVVKTLVYYCRLNVCIYFVLYIFQIKLLTYIEKHVCHYNIENIER